MAPKVNLTKRVRIGDDLRYCPVVESRNGRIKPHVVFTDGKEEKHEEGAYYIEWREGAKRVRLSVGNDPVDAWSRRAKKEAELNAIAHGLPIAGSNGSTDRQLLSVAVSEFLEETKLTKKPKTLAAYKTALDYFTQSCHKLSLADVERRDMLKFVAFLRDEKGSSPRTVYNKFEVIMSFLKSRGIRNLVGKTDWPRFTEEKPEIYEPAQLDVLSAVSDAQERLWWDFFLMTGMREQEAMHVYWRDIDLTGAIVKVTHKPDLGWTPKAYKERDIPIPTRLVTSLRAALKTRTDKACNLVFPTSGCRPKLDFLDCLKAVAERAKLDPSDFWLHKFRATFATWHLRASVDLRTVQEWMGHSDIESTMRYLSPSMTPETKAKVNKTFA
jgi:integrase/recombinase XerD